MRCTKIHFVLLAPTVIENWSIAEQDVEVAEKKRYFILFSLSSFKPLCRVYSEVTVLLWNLSNINVIYAPYCSTVFVGIVHF